MSKGVQHTSHTQVTQKSCRNSGKKGWNWIEDRVCNMDICFHRHVSCSAAFEWSLLSFGVKQAIVARSASLTSPLLQNLLLPKLHASSHVLPAAVTKYFHNTPPLRLCLQCFYRFQPIDAFFMISDFSLIAVRYADERVWWLMSSLKWFKKRQRIGNKSNWISKSYMLPLYSTLANVTTLRPSSKLKAFKLAASLPQWLFVIHDFYSEILLFVLLNIFFSFPFRHLYFFSKLLHSYAQSLERWAQSRAIKGLKLWGGCYAAKENIFLCAKISKRESARREILFSTYLMLLCNRLRKSNVKFIELLCNFVCRTWRKKCTTCVQTLPSSKRSMSICCIK